MTEQPERIFICGKNIHIGDYVKVMYTTGKEFKGGTIKGKVVELWDDKVLQAQVESGWCFHNHDRIIEHEKKGGKV